MARRGAARHDRAEHIVTQHRPPRHSTAKLSTTQHGAPKQATAAKQGTLTEGPTRAHPSVNLPSLMAAPRPHKPPPECYNRHRNTANTLLRRARCPPPSSRERKIKKQQKDLQPEEINGEIVFSNLRNPGKIFTPLFGDFAKSRTLTESQRQKSRNGDEAERRLPESTWQSACPRH